MSCTDAQVHKLDASPQFLWGGTGGDFDDASNVSGAYAKISSVDSPPKAGSRNPIPG
jgi:hypothetical protein